MPEQNNAGKPEEEAQPQANQGIPPSRPPNQVGSPPEPDEPDDEDGRDPHDPHEMYEQERWKRMGLRAKTKARIALIVIAAPLLVIMYTETLIACGANLSDEIIKLVGAILTFYIGGAAAGIPAYYLGGRRSQPRERNYHQNNDPPRQGRQ